MNKNSNTFNMHIKELLRSENIQSAQQSSSVSEFCDFDLTAWQRMLRFSLLSCGPKHAVFCHPGYNLGFVHKCNVLWLIVLLLLIQLCIKVLNQVKNVFHIWGSTACPILQLTNVLGTRRKISSIDPQNFVVFSNLFFFIFKLSHMTNLTPFVSRTTRFITRSWSRYHEYAWNSVPFSVL